MSSAGGVSDTTSDEIGVMATACAASVGAPMMIGFAGAPMMIGREGAPMMIGWDGAGSLW